MTLRVCTPRDREPNQFQVGWSRGPVGVATEHPRSNVTRQFAFLTGPDARLDTIGGYLSYKVFGSVTLLVALYAAVQGAQVVRGSESKGLVDLWLSTGRTRSQIFCDRTLSFALVLAAILVAIYAGTGLSGALSGEQLWRAALGQCRRAARCLLLPDYHPRAAALALVEQLALRVQRGRQPLPGERRRPEISRI